MQENERQRVSWQILQLLFLNSHFFPSKIWMNLISNQLSTASITYLNWPSPVFGRFQNGCNKVVIKPHVVQFWSEIILVISKFALWFRVRTARSFDLKSRVWFQPKLHSTQSNYHYLSNYYISISCSLRFPCRLIVTNYL